MRRLIGSLLVLCASSITAIVGGTVVNLDGGVAEAPRIFSAGRHVLVTGRHGSRDGGPTFDGPYEIRRAVRQEIDAGATWIKIAISGGIADEHDDIAASHMTKDEVEVVTDIAHRHGSR